MLRNLGVPAAVDLARASAERAPMAEIDAQSRLDLVDSLLMAGRVERPRSRCSRRRRPCWPTPRCRTGGGASSAAGSSPPGSTSSPGTPATALTRAERGGRGRGEARGRRYGMIARLVLARAQAGWDRPSTTDRVDADLDRLAEVAAMEAWWLAADVAADTGLDQGLAVARHAAARLLEHAGEHRADLERAVGARLS